MIKIGRVICKHCSADYYIEPKYEITKCEFCKIPIILKYSVAEIGYVSDDEIEKLKSINKFFEITDTSECTDRYKLTYHTCSKCNKRYYVDPSIDITVCEFCNTHCNISASLSAEDKKNAEEIKRIKAKTVGTSINRPQIKSAQKVSTETSKAVKPKENKSIFSILFGKK